MAGLSDAEKPEGRVGSQARGRTARENLLAGRDTVKEWTVADLAPALDSGLRGRNFNRGRELFGAVGCYNCRN
ncbi:MAG: hypothetical protein KIT22_02190 [Verrucomicrobiae bacterium]|nr:hypothetical protein [Verrucomicrobiae bacterium]